MLRKLQLLESSRVVEKFEILDFKQGESFYFLRIKAILKNGNELRIKEYVSENEYSYSYHWQDNEGRLITRWDNSPHHKHLNTFPHHRHTPDIEESRETNIEEVLKVIEEKLKEG
ncbi:MAG: DUF6516 family protein [Candidatus Freyarchaeum deiterrae]